MAIAATSTAVSVSQQNAQAKYQQDVERQNMIAAQNKAAADMKLRQKETTRKQATARAQMASTGIDSTSGSFLDLIGQGAAAGEMDVLKAKHDGDVTAWSLNNKINELETYKKNAWLESGLAALSTGVSSAITMGIKGKPGDPKEPKDPKNPNPDGGDGGGDGGGGDGGGGGSLR